MYACAHEFYDNVAFAQLGVIISCARMQRMMHIYRSALYIHTQCVYIYTSRRIDTGVCEKTLLRIRRQEGQLASTTPTA